MKAHKISLIIVGLIWFSVSARLFISGIQNLLTGEVGPKIIIFASIAIAIGLVKGKFVLQKVANKYCNNAKSITFTQNDIFLGWIKVLGIRGFVLLGIMMGIGYFLRNSSIDKSILGIICLAVSLGLGYASRVFFANAKTLSYSNK